MADVVVHHRREIGLCGDPGLGEAAGGAEVAEEGGGEGGSLLFGVVGELEDAGDMLFGPGSGVGEGGLEDDDSARVGGECGAGEVFLLQGERLAIDGFAAVGGVGALGPAGVVAGGVVADDDDGEVCGLGEGGGLGGVAGGVGGDVDAGAEAGADAGERGDGRGCGAAVPVHDDGVGEGADDGDRVDAGGVEG